MYVYFVLYVTHTHTHTHTHARARAKKKENIRITLLCCSMIECRYNGYIAKEKEKKEIQNSVLKN